MKIECIVKLATIYVLKDSKKTISNHKLILIANINKIISNESI